MNLTRRGLLTGTLALLLAPPELVPHRRVWALGGLPERNLYHVWLVASEVGTAPLISRSTDPTIPHGYRLLKTVPPLRMRVAEVTWFPDDPMPAAARAVWEGR